MPDPATQNAAEPAAASAAAQASACLAEKLGIPASQVQSLLRIRVPAHVTLASQRATVQEITELGPGSIVKFNKTCDQPLDLYIGDQPIAHGEVVKVGDKFGLRISGLAR